MKQFYKLTETINKKKEKRIVSITVKPVLRDMSGVIWLTDLMLQEGDCLTGYIPYTEVFLGKHLENGQERPPVWYNALVRTKETLVLFNLGKTSAGLDISIIPSSDLAPGSVMLAQGSGGQKAFFPEGLQAGDEILVNALDRSATRNGQFFVKEGFFQYSAAWDSKHIVSLEQGKSAMLLFTLQEMEERDEI